MYKFGGYALAGALIVAIALPSCAPRSAIPSVSAEEAQTEARRQLVFRTENLGRDAQRIQNVSYRVLTANAGLCEKTGAKFGLSFLALDSIPEEIRQIARERMGIERRITLMAVVPGSPGEKAGLRPGDVVTGFAGTPLPAGEQGVKKMSRLLGRATPGRAVRIVVIREGEKKNFTVVPVKGCAYPVYLADRNDNNAFTDGRRIVIHRGMLPLARSDEELALVVGHELAHITNGHLNKQAANQVAGTFGGLALDLAVAAVGVNTGGAFTRAGGKIGRAAYSQDFEREADYVGMYYVARAGYETAGVESFWRKMADTSAESISFAGTHPSSAERFLMIRQTHKEITVKRKTGQALVPNEKPRG